MNIPVLKGIQKPLATKSGVFGVRFIAQIKDSETTGKFYARIRVGTAKRIVRLANIYDSIIADGQTISPDSGKKFVLVVVNNVPKRGITFHISYGHDPIDDTLAFGEEEAITIN